MYYQTTLECGIPLSPFSERSVFRLFNLTGFWIEPFHLIRPRVDGGVHAVAVVAHPATLYDVVWVLLFFIPTLWTIFNEFSIFASLFRNTTFKLGVSSQITSRLSDPHINFFNLMVCL